MHPQAGLTGKQPVPRSLFFFAVAPSERVVQWAVCCKAEISGNILIIG
jgi:hypothetical protein